MCSFFVTGTDTNIGKTVAATVLASGLKTHYWKPVQTGASEGRDSDFVARWIGRDSIVPEGYLLSEPLSPDVAAAREGVEIELRNIQRPKKPVVVEGAGGVLVPLNRHETMLDLMCGLNLPVVVVARTSLGTINHTLLTIEALRRRQLRIGGVLFIGDAQPLSVASIAHHGSVSIIGTIPFCQNFTAKWFEDAYRSLTLPLTFQTEEPNVEYVDSIS